MRCWTRVATFVVVCLCAMGALARNAMGEDTPTPAARLFDTGKALPSGTLAGADGWTEVAQGDTAHKFTGDAVVRNDKLAAVVLRPAGRASRSTRLGAPAPAMRAVLAPDASGAPLAGLAAVKATKVSPEVVALEVTYHVPGGIDAGLSLEMKMGEPQVKTTPLRGPESPGREGALPVGRAAGLLR